MGTPGSSLFRDEALRAQQQQWLGELRMATPLPARILALVAVGLAGLLGTFAIAGTYTRRVTASGMLAPTTGLLAVVAPVSGRLQTLTVREGDSVHAGQLLAVISGDRYSLAGDTNHAVLVQLRSQRDRLDSEIAQAVQLGEQEARGLEQRIRLLEAQLRSLGQRHRLAQAEAQQSGALLRRIAPLGDKGYVSAFEIARQRSQQLEADAQVKLIEQQVMELRVQIESAREQLRQSPVSLATRRSVLARQRDGIDQAIAQAEAERATVLRAAVTGRVTAVLTVPGQTVSHGQTLISLAPVNAPLMADLLLPREAAGFVRAGQRVALRLSAFPYQKFGLLGGTIAQVSQSALTQSEVATLLGGQAPPVPLYRVRARLDAQHIMAYGRPEALRPGMALDADVLLDRRRLIEWVFEPLLGFARRAPAHASGLERTSP